MVMDYISAAISSGAVAVICEKFPEITNNKVCWTKVQDSSEALGIASSNFYNNPSSSLKLVGVTGTKRGKRRLLHFCSRCFTRFRL